MSTKLGKPRWGHFVCSLLTSRHDVCKDDQLRLYGNDIGEFKTYCKRCGIPVNVKINPKNRKEYFVEKLDA